MRYRCNGGGTKRNIDKFHHVDRLGKIFEIRGYRVRCLYKMAEGHKIPITNEYVLVKGENGTARYSGLLWGYYGEGPRGLIQLLKKIGYENCEKFVHETPRNSNPGTDFNIFFTDNEVISTSFYGKAA